MKNKLSKKKLKKMIFSDFADLSTEEIKALIQKEVNKEPDEIDTDYIDLCFELLSIKSNQQNAHKAKSVKPVKIILVAAMLMIAFISTITVSAQIKLNIPQKIAQLIDGDAKLDYNLKGADTTADGYALSDTDLAKELAEYGFSPITLPGKMVEENCKITKIDHQAPVDFLNIVEIKFEYNGQEGSLSLLQKTGKWDGTELAPNVQAAQMIKANGMDIFVFEYRYGCSIRYRDNLTDYYVDLDCDLDTAIQFAESIK